MGLFDILARLPEMNVEELGSCPCGREMAGACGYLRYGNFTLIGYLEKEGGRFVSVERMRRPDCVFRIAMTCGLREMQQVDFIPRDSLPE